MIAQTPWMVASCFNGRLGIPMVRMRMALRCGSPRSRADQRRGVAGRPTMTRAELLSELETG